MAYLGAVTLALYMRESETGSFTVIFLKKSVNKELASSDHIF